MCTHRLWGQSFGVSIARERHSTASTCRPGRSRRGFKTAHLWLSSYPAGVTSPAGCPALPMLGALNGSFRPGLQKSPPSGTHSPAGHHPCDFTAVQAGDVVLPRNPPREVQRSAQGSLTLLSPLGLGSISAPQHPKVGQGSPL